METILKRQTQEQILDDFKRLRDSGYNLEGFIPSFYKSTIELFQSDIDELVRISSSETDNSIFINKSILIYLKPKTKHYNSDY